MKALMIGGTGPTGVPIVEGLLERGYRVDLLHSGRREIAEIENAVGHLHADVYDPDELARVLQSDTWDVCIAAYGRLRTIALLLANRVARFISIGGLPSLRGYMNPHAFDPPGMPVPTPVNGPRVVDERLDTKGYRVARTEELVFRHQPDATHFRYPFLYGPRQPVPREWLIVRRILDERPHIVLPDGGLTLHHFGYSENMAHALLLALDDPTATRGKIYNAGDDEVLTLRSVVELIAAAFGHTWEIINMPWELATPARPLVGQRLPTHRVVDTTEMRRDFGYSDLVPPRVAVVRAAQWLAANPLSAEQESLLEDPFDYDAEDALIAGWRAAISRLPEVSWPRPPGFGKAYSGPGGRPRSVERFDS